jgi:hypothetical protein
MARIARRGRHAGCAPDPTISGAAALRLYLGVPRNAAEGIVFVLPEFDEPGRRFINAGTFVIPTDWYNVRDCYDAVAELRPGPESA